LHYQVPTQKNSLSQGFLFCPADWTPGKFFQPNAKTSVSIFFRFLKGKDTIIPDPKEKINFKNHGGDL